MTNILVFQ